MHGLRIFEEIPMTTMIIKEHRTWAIIWQKIKSLKLSLKTQLHITSYLRLFLGGLEIIFIALMMLLEYSHFPVILVDVRTSRIDLSDPIGFAFCVYPVVAFVLTMVLFLGVIAHGIFLFCRGFSLFDYHQRQSIELNRRIQERIFEEKIREFTCPACGDGIFTCSLDSGDYVYYCPSCRLSVITDYQIIQISNRSVKHQFVRAI
jgi:predicted RNA-binding Zn-ribbon protein involved in translation (DUF1610 family)